MKKDAQWGFFTALTLKQPKWYYKIFLHVIILLCLLDAGDGNGAVLHNTHIEVRGQLGRVCSLFPPYGFWGSNSVCQSWQHHFYPLSHFPGPIFLLLKLKVHHPPVSLWTWYLWLTPWKKFWVYTHNPRTWEGSSWGRRIAKNLRQLWLYNEFQASLGFSWDCASKK